MDEPVRAQTDDWLLVPGWGFGPSVFDELRAALPPAILAQAVACRDARAVIDRRAAAVRAGVAGVVVSVALGLGAHYCCHVAGRGGATSLGPPSGAGMR